MPSLELSDDRHVGSQLLVNHESEDAHHGCPSVVELNATLAGLPLIRESVPRGDAEPVSEVTRELRLPFIEIIVHNAELEDADEGNNLREAILGDRIGAEERGEAARVRREGMAGVVDVPAQKVAGPSCNLSKEGKHGNSAVLDLDISQAVKPFLIGVIEHAKRVEESERGLGSDFRLDCKRLSESFSVDVDKVNAERTYTH